MINNKDENPLRIYEARYRTMDTNTAAERTGTIFDAAGSAFKLTVLNQPLFVSWPAFSLHGAFGSIDSPAARLLVLRYLLEGRDAPGSGRFLSYRELPWGAVYDANFQGRCIKRLAFAFGSRPDAFEKACLLLAGTPIEGADVGYEISFLDKHRLRLLLWSGDEEFPPSSQILFSDDFALAFSAEDMAVVGDLVINRLRELAK